ncbi:dTDP-4-dehydrorhamnose reductase [Pseudomonadota bacterium]
MIILLTGASGQLGQELLPQLAQLGDVVPVDRTAFPGLKNMQIQDLGDLNRVETLLNRIRPEVIINAAAYTAVDLAEDEDDIAFTVNRDLPQRIARWCHRNDRMLVHYSTDYVFDGQASQPYLESDTTGPLGVYGESKLAGERAISQSGCRHLILRTSWVYSGHGNNFLLTMLKLARTRPSLSIVNDQLGRPTWARNLARVTRKVIEHAGIGRAADEPSGIYHYCDRDAVSWYEFANGIFKVAREAGLLTAIPETTPVPSSAFPQKAVRPLYSVLDTSRIQDCFGISPVGLEDSLKACIKDIACK